MCQSAPCDCTLDPIGYVSEKLSNFLSFFPSCKSQNYPDHMCSQLLKSPDFVWKILKILVPHVIPLAYSEAVVTA